VPADPIFVHVGLPKTGSTQVQRILWRNRDLLRSQGVSYPGRTRRAHFHAALDVIGSSSPEVADAWNTLAGQVMSTPGRAVISHEMLAAARERQVERIMDSFTGREVHMVITLRDFSRIVPATWQERAKNRQVEPWQEYLSDVAAGPAGKHRFWRLQDAPRVLRTWHKFLPSDQVHAVIVPPLTADRSLLFKRFASVVGFDAEACEMPESAVNESIGAVEIALLQRINTGTELLSWPDYRRLVKNHLVTKLLAPRPDQIRVVLPESTRPWVTRETDRIRQTIADIGCVVVGDVDELTPMGIGAVGPSTTDSPDLVSIDDVLQASTQVTVGLLTDRGDPTDRPE
jgi:hypothetical protein